MSFKEKIKNGLIKFKENRKLQIYAGVIIFSIIVVAGGLIVYSNTRPKPEKKIQTYAIPENEKIFINGMVVPKQSKNISGPANGSTPDIRVSNGQNVKKGDVLYIVKDEVAISEISSIKSQINTLIKEKRNLKSDDPTLSSINSQIASLNTNLSTANAKAYTRIKAPFDGKVYLNEQNGEASSVNTENSSLMTVQSTEYVMNGQISEQDLSKIKTDMTADVTILSSGDTVKGRVSYISERPVTSQASTPASSTESASNGISFYSIVFKFDTQEGIVDGYHAQATIEVANDKHKVPSSAIVNNGDEVYVFALKDGVLHKTYVEIISENDNFSVITGDLSQNDIIVKNPTKTMNDGDAVPETQDSANKKNED